MNQHDIPDDLAGALRSAANAAPGHRGDVAAVRQRGRARRRHRTAAAAGFAAVAAAAAIAVPSVVSGQGAPPEPGPLPGAERSQPSGPAAPAQRLLIHGSGQLEGNLPEGDFKLDSRELYERYRDDPDVSGVLSMPAEVLPNGSVAELDLDLPGTGSVREFVPMPDGRLAAIGIVDRMPGVHREDGACVAGLELPLLVVEADGSVSSTTRDVRVRCEHVNLIAADADTAYLVRDGSRLVAHDLATGDERVVIDSPEAFATDHGPLASFSGGRLVSPADDACAPVMRVTEVSTGVTDEYPLAEPDQCLVLGGRAQLSPDGKHAAVAIHEMDDRVRTGLRVLVVDLDSGTVVADQPVTGTIDEDGRQSAEIAGLAWQDDQTLRVAWYEQPEPEDGLHWLPDLIEVTTISR